MRGASGTQPLDHWVYFTPQPKFMLVDSHCQFFIFVTSAASQIWYGVCMSHLVFCFVLDDSIGLPNFMACQSKNFIDNA